METAFLNKIVLDSLFFKGLLENYLQGLKIYRGGERGKTQWTVNS